VGRGRVGILGFPQYPVQHGGSDAGQQDPLH
jgi:hypothetical protein